jgi:NAD+ diphosphatase
MSIATVFSGGRVDRAAHLRADAPRLAGDPAARWLPFWRGRPLLDVAEDRPRLGWLPASGAPGLSGFDGMESLFLGMAEGPRFACDVTAALPHLPEPEAAFSDPTLYELSAGLRFGELRSVMGALSPEDAGDAATARGLLEWRRTHPRCSRCGGATALEEGGWRTGCPDCGAKHFPRTDPVVIMLVLSGDRALLGRQKVWPDRMYSLLAGFVEPGETIEEAVRRETMEETGVPVGAVAYVCSQPWPFPASLMIGCVARATGEDIRRADEELEDALWAPREEVAASLAGGAARFTAARRGAVARTLLEAWARGEIDAPS